MIVEYEDVKPLLRLEKSGADKYPVLPTILEQVSAAIENHCQRFFLLDEYVESEYFEGREIPLKALPISTIKAVSVDGKNQVLNWRIRGDRIVFRDHMDGVYKITYKGGFDELPPDVKRAAVLQVCHEFQRSDHIGSTSVTDPGGTVEYSGQLALLKEVVRLLAPYRNFAKGGW